MALFRRGISLKQFVNAVLIKAKIKKNAARTLLPMKLKPFVLVGMVAALATLNARAQVGLGIKASTLGAGADFIAAIPVEGQQKLNIRLNGNYFSYDRTATYSDIHADGKLRMQSVGLLADWYPTGGSFHVSAGGYWNGNKIDATGKPVNGSYTFNGQTYTSDQVGSLEGKATLGHSFAPYAGIGWGNPVGASKHWSFFVDAGALFTGSPKLSLTPSGGTFSNDPTLRANLEVQRQKAQGDVNFASVYPVVGLGFAYAF